LGQYDYDNYLSAILVSENNQFNFEFKYGLRTNQPVYNQRPRKYFFDQDKNQIKKIVKWYHPIKGGLTHSL
jgi:hypothetical protein